MANKTPAASDGNSNSPPPVHALALPRESGYDPAHEHLDPSRILSRLLGGTADWRADSRTSDGSSRPLRRPREELVSHSRMLAWAADHLPLHTGDILPAGLSLAAAGEHTTFFDAPSQRWIKLTRPGVYGAQAQDAGAYLQRWALFNRVFADDVRIEGMVMLPGEDDYRMVISQSDAPALNPADPAASVQQVEAWLPSKGFELWEGEWIHPVTGLRVWDLGNANAIRTHSGLRPVDIQIEPANADMLRRLRSTRPTGQAIGTRSNRLFKAPTAPGLASRAYHAVENIALNTLEGSFSAGSALTRATGTNLRAYHKLLLPVTIGGVPLAAKITVQEDSNGNWFFDTALLETKQPADVSTGLATLSGSQTPDIQRPETQRHHRCPKRDRKRGAAGCLTLL